MQDVGDDAAELFEPAVGGFPRRALGEHDGIVLIHGEQALATTGRAEHAQRVRRRRLAMALRQHAAFGQNAGAAGERAEFARNHRRDVARADTFGDQAGGRLRQARPGGGERWHVVGLVDRVAEDRGFLRAQPQQVARGDDAADLAFLVFHAEMAQLEPAHAAERAVEEGGGRQRDQRLAGELRDRAGERAGALFGQGAQHVALGDDGGVARAHFVAGAGRGHQQGGNLLARHALQRIAERDVGGDEFRRRAHHVGDAMTVGICIDTREHALRARVRCCHRVFPAGAVLILEHAGERQTGLLGLGQRADISFAQLGQQREEDPCGGGRVADRGMAVLDRHAEPARQRLDGVAAETGLGHLRQQPGIERARLGPGQAGQFAFAPQHREIEAERVTDQHGAGNLAGDLRPGGGETRRAGHVQIADAMDLRRLVGNGSARIDQPAQRCLLVEPAAAERHHADFDDARLARIEAGGLGVDDHGVERDQRRCIDDGCHRPPGMAARIS